MISRVRRIGDKREGRVEVSPLEFEGVEGFVAALKEGVLISKQNTVIRDTFEPSKRCPTDLENRVNFYNEWPMREAPHDTLSISSGLTYCSHLTASNEAFEASIGEGSTKNLDHDIPPNLSRRNLDCTKLHDTGESKLTPDFSLRSLRLARAFRETGMRHLPKEEEYLRPFKVLKLKAKSLFVRTNHTHLAH